MPWLTVVTFLPLVGVPVLLAWRRVPSDVARWIALAIAVATFIVSLGMLGRFEPSASGFQMVEQAGWVGPLGIRYLLGVDGVSLFMVLLTTFLFPVSLLASWRIERNVPAFMASMLVLETAVIGTFLALDLLLFFLFFEAMLFPMYLIIGAWGYERRVYAAVKFFLFTMFGSAFLLVAILWVSSQAGTFDVRQLTDLDVSGTAARSLFLAFFVAFAVKVPVFPLHTWLPDAHTEAPTAGSVILAALLLKIGAYGLIRFNLTMFPEASRYFADGIQILALIGIVYGAVVAMMQADLKRLIAYSSVSHLGFVVLGIFAFTDEAVAGGVLQMVNHGLSTGALFLLVGMVYDRTHTRRLDEMGGLASVTPWLAGAFLFAALSSLGLPGLNNFVGEFLIILGSFADDAVFASIAAVGVVLAAIYLLWSYQRMANGPVPEVHRHHPDMSLREHALVVPVLAAILVLGVYPKLLLDRIEPTTGRVVQQVGGADALTTAGGVGTVEAAP
jgi:NADH-quinone oxidoreductase subunit M